MRVPGRGRPLMMAGGTGPGGPVVDTGERAAPARQRRPGWVRVATWWACVLPFWAVGVWAAVHVVTGFGVPAPLDRELLGAAVVALASAVLTGPVLVGVHGIARRYGRRVGARVEHLITSGLLRALLLALVYQLALRLLLLLGAGLALWLGAAVARAGGLDVHLTPGGAVVAALVVLLVAMATTALAAWAASPHRILRAAVGACVAAGLVGGLWLVESLLPGARFEPDENLAESVLTLALLAGAFQLVRIDLRIPYATTVIRVIVNGLELWLVSWVSTGLLVTLHIAGFWTFLAAAVIVTAATRAGEFGGVLVLARWRPRRPAGPAGGVAAFLRSVGWWP